MIISIDPSPDNTAMVVVDETTGAVLWAETFPAVEFIKKFDEVLWRNQNEWNQPFPLVAIERPPHSPGRMSAESSQTIGAYWHFIWVIKNRLYANSMPEIRSVAPGTWKPPAKGWGIAYPADLADVHQRDAYAIVIVTMQGRIPFERKA